VLLDAADAVLLLSTRDASNPAFGTSWELPGGGITAGEDLRDAAVREIREETGIQLATADIRRPLWHRDVHYTYRGERRLQRGRSASPASWYSARDRDPGREVIERQDHEQHRWWLVDELQRSAVRFYPAACPCTSAR
jgi:8-oxo-dGTP pyrophosphatase MutT (NUDIX family)